jgi:hypothetical protein
MSRRKFLQSTSTCLSLPFLESLYWREARAATVVRPLKTGFIMFPMGTHVDSGNNCMLEGGRSWLTPDVTNGQLDFSRREALKSLNDFKNDLIFPLNFYIRDDILNDSPHGGTGQFLSVAGFSNQPFFPSNFERNVRSIDQYIGTKLGLSRLKLEHLNMVGVEVFQMKSGIDGSEQASKANVYASWKALDVNGNQDLQAADEQLEYQPKDLFDKLFPNSMSNMTSAEVIKNRRKKSILDSLVTDLSGLRGKLGSADKLQLDRYTASVRDLEKSITDPTGPVCSANQSNTFGTSGGYGDYDSGSPNKGGVRFISHAKQMMDVLALGMACDHVKLVTYVLDNRFYGRRFQMLYDIEFHAATHLDGSFGTNGFTLEQLAKEYRAYNALYVSMFSYLLQKLKDNDSLNSSLLAFGSGMNMYRSSASLASNHHSTDLPIILAGRANGKVTPGRIVDLGKKVRLGTLWRKIHQIATDSDVDLGKSLGGYYTGKSGVIFDRSDNVDVPL